ALPPSEPPLLLEVFPALELVRDDQTQGLDLRVDFGDVLATGLLVRAPLKAPFDVALGPRGVRLAEHVEPDDVPLVDRGLRLRPALVSGAHELFELLLSVADVSLFLAEDLRQVVLDRLIRRADHLVQLVLADLVDEHPERGEVRPRRHVLLERLDLALAARPREDVGPVGPDEAEEPQHLAAVVDLLGGDARDPPLIVDRRRAERPVIDVDVGTADLAVRLDREEPREEVLILLRHLRKVLGLDLVREL